MKKIALSDKIHSKWLILFIDQFVIVFTLFIAIILTDGRQFINPFNEVNYLFVSLYTLTATVLFIFLKINTGIIRYSNTEDMLRIFLAILAVSLAFIFVYELIGLRFPIHLDKIGKVLVLNYFISSSLLVLLRIMVRVFYAFIKSAKEIEKENILIYGSDPQALLIKRAIDHNECSKLNVIGFVDDDIHRTDKYIEQKRVFPFSLLPFLKEKYSLQKILVVENALNTANKIKIMEVCCNADVHVIKVPSPDKWLYGKFDANQLKDLEINDLLEREPIQLDKKNILKELSGKCILVTGAAGSIGSEIVRQVQNYHPKLLILCDQAETPLHELKLDLEDHNQADGIKVFIGNIQNLDRMRTLFERYKPEIVFHAAAYKHVPMMEENPSEAILTNVLGTKNLADICIDFGVEKFVMISTDKAVRPTNIMGASKRLAEIYIQSLNNVENIVNKNGRTKFITTRFGNVLGSNGSVIPRFKSQIDRRVPITVTHPNITRYFMTIPEAVELVMEAGAMGKGGEIFLFDMGKPIKIVDLALNMIKLAGLKPYIDIDIVFTGLRPGEKVYEELLLLEEKMIHTHHPKIKISQHINHNYFYVNQLINDLVVINQKGDDSNTVKKMKEILPEFISNNSTYEVLDLLQAN